MSGLRRMAVVVVAGFWMLPAQAATPPDEPVADEPPALTEADVAAWLDGYVPYAIATADVVGAVVTVVKDGRILANRGYGFADIAERRPVNPDDTMFRVASISKLFTWTAVMQLVESGQLDLDTDVEAYLDFDLGTPRGTVTLRHIMTHTAGFEETLKDSFNLDQNLPADLLRVYLTTRSPEQIHRPGETPAYSNYATALAGYIVERVSGEPFETYVENRIFRPLGMTRSTFRQPVPDDLRGHLATGYETLSDGRPQAFEVLYDTPAGALSTSGADMGRFMIAHLEEGEGLMRPDTAHRMQRTIDRHFPVVDSMALGFYEMNHNGLRIIGHGGDILFFHSDLFLIPERGVGVFVSMNSGGDGAASFWIRDHLARAFVDRYFPAARTAPVALPTAREHGDLLAGTYEFSRRSASSAFALPYFMMQSRVSVNDEGELEFSIFSNLNGSAKTWVEVEPWIWQARSGGERLAARLVDGHVNAFTAEPVSATMVFQRAPWYRSSAWLLPALGLAAGVFLLTALSWPVRAFARSRFDVPFPFTGARALAYRAAPVVALLILAHLAAWGGYFAWLFSSPLGKLDADTSGVWLTALYTLSLLPLLGLATLGWVNWVVWRDDSGWFTRLWAALLALAACTVVWFAWVTRLFSFNLDI